MAASQSNAQSATSTGPFGKWRMYIFYVLLFILAVSLFLWVYKPNWTSSDTISTTSDVVTADGSTEVASSANTSQCGNRASSAGACMGTFSASAGAESNLIYIPRGHCFYFEWSVLDYVDTFYGVPGDMKQFQSRSENPKSHYYQFKARSDLDKEVEIGFEIRPRGPTGCHNW